MEYKMKRVNTKNAPQAIGPYSQAKIIGNLVFTSGQIPLKPDGTLLFDSFENESIQVLDNINEILMCAFILVFP